MEGLPAPSTSAEAASHWNLCRDLKELGEEEEKFELGAEAASRSRCSWELGRGGQADYEFGLVLPVATLRLSWTGGQRAKDEVGDGLLVPLAETSSRYTGGSRKHA